ncbi:MAG: cation transporter [Micavibrio aeruginosavorus]|uniref:Cation transporter n=1 Tax=Micavibrio aeruginosavorus TaxID=349221 RepID=A0A7T5R3C9_9BACT|nr:MAG: cation transporter [Micavibrio aeruginosavorus]
MEDHHGHDHSGHNHHNVRDMTDKKLTMAVIINVGLTFAQIAGGIFSGSLALIADALHNFSDAASLLLAVIARRIAKRKPDNKRTYGYQRIETVAALINLTSLILIGFWLGTEAVIRFIEPQPVEGWTVIIVAGIALIIDAATALLTWKESKTSQNIRAAFLHNIADALSSVGVIIGGALILLYGWTIIDPIITLVISAYVMLQAAKEFPAVLNLLLDGAPESVNADALIHDMRQLIGIKGVHHVHVRRLDEQRNALEAHIVIDDLKHMEEVKTSLKAFLANRYDIAHSTLEFETVDCKGNCS